MRKLNILLLFLPIRHLFLVLGCLFAAVGLHLKFLFGNYFARRIFNLLDFRAAGLHVLFQDLLDPAQLHCVGVAIEVVGKHSLAHIHRPLSAADLAHEVLAQCGWLVEAELVPVAVDLAQGQPQQSFESEPESAQFEAGPV